MKPTWIGTEPLGPTFPYVVGLSQPPPTLRYPDSRAAAEALGQLLDRPEHECTMADHGRVSWVSSQGLLVVAGTTDARIGFGVRSGLAVSVPLIAAIAEVNRCDPLGHLWLTDRGEDAAWALLWGATLPYRWTRALDLQRAVFACLTDQRDYLTDLVNHFAPFGGDAYWPDRPNRRDHIRTGRGLLEDLT